MKGHLLLAIPLVACAVFAAQSSLPPQLVGHARALHEAGTLTATLTVQPPGGAPDTFRIAYSKPNLFRIERSDGFLLSDGKSVFEYTKSGNVYDESPLSDWELQRRAGADEVWAWAPFFMGEPTKGYRAGKVGGNRNLRGQQVTEVEVALGGDREGTAILFVDSKLGIARGFRIKTAEGEMLVVATEIQVAKDALPVESFAFRAPEGAKKAEEIKAEATYAAVQALFNRRCMPCHGTQASGGLNLTTYDGIRAGVVPGDPDGSRIVRSIRAQGPGRMPRNGPPLTAREIDLVVRWIQEGAKP